jgi:oxamate amidohydrolase
MSERFDVSALAEADYVHVLVEAAKLAFADRDRYVADPDFMRVTAAELLDPARLARIAGRISLKRALPTTAAAAPGGDTVAIVTADGEGNAVSLIQSLYFTWGSGVVAGHTGVVLQNRGAFFSLDPTEPNALAPGKRTMHTLIPSLYLAGGQPRFAYGTMGGEGQPQTQAALLTRRLHRGFGPQGCVEAPRWLYGRTWGAPIRALTLEGRYPVEMARDLSARGHHDVRMGQQWDDLFGHAQCIWMAGKSGGFAGGSDPRADGAAIGF